MRYFLIVAIFNAFIYIIALNESSVDLRNKLHTLLSAGNYKDILKHLKRIEDEFGTLAIDYTFPSLYLYKGVAYHGLHLLADAEKSFIEGVKHFPNEARSWINLGEIQTLLLKFNESEVSYEEAFRLGERTALPRFLTAKGWVDSWRNMEMIASEVEKDSLSCMEPKSSCLIESAFGLEYTDIPVPVSKYIHSMSPVTHNSEYIIHPNTRAQISLHGKDSKRRLRVGVISSDFGVHPVSSLIRGVLDMIDKTRIELFCFSVTDAVSWWRYNLSQSVEHFDVLQGINTQDGASIIASKRIDILIDLNGHTKNSGLSYLSHRPSPIQISFLGLPSTTSARYIDYYIGDHVALPPEHADHFSEKLILMQPCYIANDYAQLQGDVIRRFSQANRAKRKALGVDIDISTASFLFGTISNSQKMDMTIFHVWMNILRRYGGSMISWTQHSGMSVAMENLRVYSEYYGISSKRLVLADLAPWLDHLYRKTSVDMFLDTAVKNGHTTGLDGIWAGVPTMTLGSGSSMPTRAGESIASALGNEVGVAYSLKEYEDMIYRFVESSSYLDDDIDALLHEYRMITDGRMSPDPLYSGGSMSKGYQLLRRWRHQVQDQRIRSPLFDTKNWTKEFTYLLEATWDATNIAARRSSKDIALSVEDIHYDINNKDHKHFFGGVSIKTKALPSTAKDAIVKNIAGVANDYPIYHVFSISRAPARSQDRDIRLYQAYDPESEVFREPSSSSLATNNINDDNNSSSDSLILDIGSGSGMGHGLRIANDTITNPHEDDVGEAATSAASTNSDASTSRILNSHSSDHLIFLNIGGIAKVDGWLNINTEPQPFPGIKTHTDLIRPLGDLTGFANNSVSIIYSCHNLEHSSFGDGAVKNALREWHRALRPGGMLLVSVPDLRALARLYLDHTITMQERWMATLMIYGSQVSAYDYHKIGFDEQLLYSYLLETGFCDIHRIASFNLFEDSSELVYKGYRISLNMQAKRCANNNNVDVTNSDALEFGLNTEPFDRNTAY